MYRVLIADDEELELKAMHFFLERNYPEAAGKLSLFCDFTICPAEGNVLPILI